MTRSLVLSDGVVEVSAARLPPKLFTVGCTTAPETSMLVDFDCAELSEWLASKATLKAITKRVCKTPEVTHFFNRLINNS
jgi:hypothetical protein